MRANCANRPFGRPRRSQDRLGSVLFSSCRSGSLFWSFWGRLGVVFGPSGGRFRAFSAVQLIDSTHQPINSSIQRINSSTYQLIIPWPFGTFLPGPVMKSFWDCSLFVLWFGIIFFGSLGVVLGSFLGAPWDMFRYYVYNEGLRKHR